MAIKMKAMSTATCKREGNYPHVSEKSYKISKIPCSMVRVAHELPNTDTPSLTSQNGFGKNEVSYQEHGSENNPLSSNRDIIVGHACLLCNCCLDSIEGDPSSISVSSRSETTLSTSSRPSDAHCNHFEAVNREETTMAQQMDNSSIFDFQTSDVLSSYLFEVCLTGFSCDRITVFDDSLNYNTLSNPEFAWTNLVYDVTEGTMLFPTLEDTIEAADYHYGGSCEEFQMSNSSNHLMCHHTIPITVEHDVNSSHFESDKVDHFDPETFIRNFLELSDESNSLPALINMEASKKKHITLVLDLDETLVHSTMKQCDNADFTIQVFIDKEYTVYVRQRPFLQEFLEKASEMFEIMIFTASKSLYAEKLLDIIDPDKRLFSRRVYRESCTLLDGTYIKDLTVLGIDLAKVVIIDNCPQVFRLQVDNGIPIESWYDDPSDSALISLLPFLEKLVNANDVRPIIAEKFGTLYR